MSSVPDPKILDRIRKLLTQAKSENLHEAQSASQIAHRMMLQNNLKVEDVYGTNSDIHEKKIEDAKFLQIWRWGLFTACAWANEAHTVRVEESLSNKTTTVFAHLIGSKKALSEAMYFFQYFEAELERGAIEAMKNFEISGRVQLDSWRHGAVIAIQNRILRSKNGDQVEGPPPELQARALAISKTAEQKARKHVEKQYKKTYTPQMWTPTWNLANECGRAFGAQIPLPREKLSKAIGTNTKKKGT